MCGCELHLQFPGCLVDLGGGELSSPFDQMHFSRPIAPLTQELLARVMEHIFNARVVREAAKITIDAGTGAVWIQG
jgi:hypothetical protein